MKNSILIYIYLLVFISCTKEDAADFDAWHVDFIPDLILNVGDSALLDVDNNGNYEVMLKIDQFQKQAALLNDSCELSMGIFIGSGTGNLDTISYQEIIDKSSQSWYPYPVSYHLFTQEINYLGIMKYKPILPGYGWIKLKLMGDSMLIDAYYFCNLPDKKIRAGIPNYN